MAQTEPPIGSGSTAGGEGTAGSEGAAPESSPEIDPITAGLESDTQALLSAHPVAEIRTEEDRFAFLEARYDAGLGAVHYPEGRGGRGLPREYQLVVDEILGAAGAPDNRPAHIIVNLGMAGPTILAAGTEEQQQRFMRQLWTGRDRWCQLFSEPGAGSDLAGLATRAVRDGDDWIISGQKVWTTLAHLADYAILLARTDPTVPKHQGITYFLLDMKSPGVTVRPMRQITGEAEFNEVFLDEVRVPDAMRLGAEGEGWRLANITLSNERSGSTKSPRREGGPIHTLIQEWRTAPPEDRDPSYRDSIARAWVRAEAVRLAGIAVQRQMAQGPPPAEASALKLASAETNKQIASLAMETAETGALIHPDGYAFHQPDFMSVETTGRSAGYSYLRTRANSIEGGTSEVLKNIIAERILRLPREPRTDTAVPFTEVPR
ncbi:acyl-CoA dehydrogenase family protein [Brevibacterium daeguense]|uniref:Acyl-CoA dehydrogenase family protein n=1 Tax=Brevibacterium daeguense TaxID=909936 RepID=A0ABP8EHW3_9MICO|nr:acyl-CoA dehydrogenase family protein [Brevibacterium daeguense]